MAKKRIWSTIGGISSERVRRDRLARVLDLGRDQLLAALLDGVGDAEQGERALGGRRVAPRLEGVGRGLHRGVDVGLGRERGGRVRLTGRRVDDIGGAAVGGLGRLAVDEVGERLHGPDHGTAAGPGVPAGAGGGASAFGASTLRTMPTVIRSVGVPREVKTAEHRVAMTPDGVRELERHGIQVYVEAGAGEGASISDADYVAAGADIVPTAADAWSQEMVVKVKEPKEDEFAFLRKDLTLFTYLHLAAYPEVAKALLGGGHDRARLRDGAAGRRRAAAAGADERGRRAPGAADGRALPRAAQRRARRADGRRARACARPRSSCSAPATSGGTRRGSPPAWRPRSC